MLNGGGGELRWRRRPRGGQWKSMVEEATEPVVQMGVKMQKPIFVHLMRKLGEIEKKYVGGCLDYFDDCNPIDMKLLVLIHMTNGLGYGTNVGFMYKIPVENGDFSLRKIEMEDDMVDMAAIGKQNGSVELYITQANNIAFLDSEVGQLGEIAEGNNEDSKGDSGSFDGEEFHDSDYDFCKDDDDVIYNQSVATAGRDLSIVLGIKEVGHEEQGIEEPEQHEQHEAGQKHKHVKATDACDVSIFHGDQFQVNEESECCPEKCKILSKKL
ncbi:hypothetical protein ACH5RR_029795 [Cinchona calisaya]|uniref:PB1-like domain-containing protein n=1 Tax=Cinchona calisaya TaxID=153742 RepID=A0ABD2YU61_9GENT